MSSNSLYRTSDLYFASYLSSTDIEMVATEQEMDKGRKKLIFIFKISDADKERCRTLFFGGAGTVKVRRFVDALKSLKEMTYI
tara:strand:+ start:692 stop:940 length:249 start_codon:yes stop_codon:yes gene_type:complete